MAAKSALTLLSLAASTSANMFVKRDSWGPAFSLGPAKYTITQTTTTIYPGKMPTGQEGGLFTWLGISNGTGDLIQSIIGSYPAGESECSGEYADTAWCISSEVYGNDASGNPNQFVGTLTTADPNYENGILLEYTLVDKSTYLWLQTMKDAVTGELLSTYNKTSGTMLGWGTALECNTYSGHACTGTSDYQYYENSTIILEEADESFVDTLGASEGVVYTDMTSSDGGKTWTIAKITIPPMVDDGTSDSSSSAAAEVEESTVAVVATPTYVSPVATYAPTTMVTLVQSTPAQSLATPVFYSTPGAQPNGGSGAQPTGFGGQPSGAAQPTGATTGFFQTPGASSAAGGASPTSTPGSFSGPWRHRGHHHGWGNGFRL